MSPHLIMLLKAPRPGGVKTRLAADTDDVTAIRIYRQMVERQLRTVPADWPVSVYFDPPGAREEMRGWLDPLRPLMGYRPQVPGDLGERLCSAFKSAFAQGSAGVLAIGGDCPGLDASGLRAAHEAWGQTDVVIGPASDGGYYLIGLNEPQPGLFAGIPWSTAEVLVQTRSRARQHDLRCMELPVRDDVDNLADWQRAVAAGYLNGWAGPR